MADKEATLRLKIISTGEKVIKNISDQFKRFASAAIRNSIASVTAALAALGAAFVKLSLDADKFNDVKNAFSNLAAKQGQDSNVMLANMRKLSAGTISDLELMQQANQALLLGLPVDKFGDMLQIARTSAKATGQSMEFMLQSIVTGLGRGSKLMLDNLGIMIDTNKAYEIYARTLGKTADELTDAEKKQGFINEALRIGKANAEAAGGGAESATDKWNQLKVSFSNITTEIGQFLLPAFDKLITATRDLMKSAEEAIKGDSQLVSVKKELNKARIEEYQAAEKVADLEKRLFSDKSQSMIQARQELELAKQKSQALNEEFKALRDKEAEEKRIADEGLARKKRETEEAAKIKADQDLIDAERDTIKKETDKENQRLFNEAMKEENNQAQLTEMNQAIMNAQSRQQALDAIKKKEAFVHKITEEQKRKETTKTAEIEKFLNSQKVADFQSTMGSISQLQNSKSKEFVAIGKAAAIADIGISTAQGVMKAWALGPILGPILAPLVAAAGIMNAAKVQGIQLADGGIVQASTGGTPAIIGEGGRDEAVIPLEDGMPNGLGSNITIIVNGGLLGDENSARELALAIDSELLKLRRNNESVAFESGIA